MLEKFRCPPEFEKYGIPCKCPVKVVSIFSILADSAPLTSDHLAVYLRAPGSI